MKRAALVLATSVALFLSGAHAATRVHTPEKPFSSIMNSAQSAIGLPYGDAAFFGQEFVSEHTAGSRFQAGQSIPGAGSSGAKVKVAIKPVVTINPPKLAASVVGALKGGNVPGLLATSAVVWAIDQIPGAEVLDGNPIIKTETKYPGGGNMYSRWRLLASGTPMYFPDPVAACSALGGTYKLDSGHENWNDTWSYVICRASNGWTSQIDRVPCSVSSGPFNPSTRLCDLTYSPPPAVETPFSDDNYGSLQDAISRVTNSDWLRDLTKAKCEGSTAPERCYEDLVDRRPNHGPASQTISSPSITTTTTNPDGSVSTKTTTTTNKYDYTYTHNSYDYKVTTTTTTTTDGQTKTEVTTEEPLAPGQEPEEEPLDEEEQPMPEISDAYKPYIDKLNDIKTDVAVAPSVVAPLGWSAWYSFGGGCSEITAELPVIGSWSTNYCPYIYDWVRPILAFMFVVFTWHYCRELWSEAVTQARPM